MSGDSACFQIAMLFIIISIIIVQLISERRKYEINCRYA